MNCTRPSPGYGGYSGYGGYGWLGGQTRTEKTKCYMRSMFSVAAVGWRDTAGRNRRLRQVLHEARSCKGLTSSSIGLQQKHEKASGNTRILKKKMHQERKSQNGKKREGMKSGTSRVPVSLWGFGG